jgi:small-conductance mechanosensitive channel
LSRLSSTQIAAEVKRLADQLGRLWSGAYWVARLEELWKPGELRILSFLLLGTIFQTLVLRARRYFKHLETQPFYRRHVWCCLAAQLLQNSLPLLGAVVFVYAYARSQALYVAYAELRALVQLLAIWLFSRWWLDFLKIKFREASPGTFPPEAVALLRRLILLARLFGFAWVIIGGFLGNTAVTLRLLRIVFGFGLAGGILRLLRICIPLWGERLQAHNRWWAALKPAVVALGYSLAGGGLLLDLMGFDQLAYHWYASLGRSAVVLLWGGVTIRVLREWDSDINGAQAPGPRAVPKQAHPLRWFFIRVAWLATGAILLVSLLMAWDVKQGVIVGILRGLNYPIPFGGMEFRLLGLIYVMLILLVTLTGTRLWRRILRQKILADSGLEVGLQESVTAISIYVLWTLGILWALKAFGVSTTSMAVAFGALGIGLGFGLQNIFNNFISGLILLLERPIQVGDTIEINGIWATVTRINVRSTVVQTFDNASLIIPNSEFISNQLTNWSFKDLRLRRKITVGVAYGSDVERVRETLLEIARSNPLVLDTPQPDVLFSDFADSALIFKLRVWTTIDDCLKVETQIRFAIDRLFRERNIQIPFPQRDVHVRGPLQASPVEEQTPGPPQPAPTPAPPPAATTAEDRT